jgi:hypothetical protein
MKIQVKNKHYKNSLGYHLNDACPLALAIKEVMPGAKVWVGGYTVRINGEKFDIGMEWSDLDVPQIEEDIEQAQEGKTMPTKEVTLTKVS